MEIVENQFSLEMNVFVGAFLVLLCLASVECGKKKINPRSAEIIDKLNQFKRRFTNDKFYPADKFTNYYRATKEVLYTVQMSIE